MDEEYDVDGGLSLYEQRDRQGTKEKAQARLHPDPTIRVWA